MADIERWITINGAHIPIIKGESRARAVANFIKSKRDAKVKSTQKRLLNEAIKPDYRNDKVAKEITKNAAKMIERGNRPTIKGRAKTLDEIRADMRRKTDEFENYMDNYYKKEYYNSREKSDEKDKIVRKYNRAEKKYLEDARNAKKTYKLKTDKPKRTITGTKSLKPTWDGKNQEIQVRFWRGNPQHPKGGYMTTRNYTARTESGLMKQIGKTENASRYGSMNYRDYITKPKRYKKKK